MRSETVAARPNSCKSKISVDRQTRPVSKAGGHTFPDETAPPRQEEDTFRCYHPPPSMAQKHLDPTNLKITSIFANYKITSIFTNYRNIQICARISPFVSPWFLQHGRISLPPRPGHPTATKTRISKRQAVSKPELASGLFASRVPRPVPNPR